MLDRPLALLRVEGLTALAAAVWGYAFLGASWWLFAVLLFVPDVSMAGYLAGPKVGAAVYNAAHTYTAPALFAAITDGVGWSLGLPVALIWVAHVGLDRALGYGLKRPDGFHHTHLGPIGPARHA